jgi:hypothetical protein
MAAVTSLEDLKLLLLDASLQVVETLSIVKFIEVGLIK